MAEDPAPPTRRRRRRATAPQGAPQAAAPGTAPAPTPAPEARATPIPPPTAEADAPARRPRRRGAPRDAGGSERLLRDLVGAGRSQVGVSGALRARDVNRPTAEDLAAAERELEIVRRNWRPS